MTSPKIIVLDDDPTGSQTVHGCLLLTRWDVETLCLGLADASPIFFVLTNTRANPPAVAAQITREVCANLKAAMATGQAETPTQTQEVIIVSRSDSTLRGHYPLETDVIAEELGPFDAHFLVPAFFEGGRVTIDGVHYLEVDGQLTPVHETEFAQDSVFGYHHSYLPDYVAEKTKGRITAQQVQQLRVADLQRGVRSQLAALEHNQCVAVDARTQIDLDRFAQDVLTAAQQGKRFLFRSAASLLTSLAQLPPQPVAATQMKQYVRQGQPGLFLVGSHVNKTTVQLRHLLQAPSTVGIEVDVTRLRDHPEQVEAMVAPILAQMMTVHKQGQTPVIYTSRQELTFADAATRLNFGVAVSQLLMTIVENLPPTLGYLVSKGGITSNDTLSQGLKLQTARLLGQILPGCSVVRTGADHPTVPDLPVVLFPGNVGDPQALVTVLARLTP